jgi:hypothetical protein
MKKVVLLAFILLVAAGFVAPQMNAQTTHNVTFIVNTATVPDTITSKSTVVITGGGSNGGDSVLTSWGSGVVLDTIGGDYWMKTLTFADSASIAYKIRIGSNGWEENSGDPSTNRTLTVVKDTVMLVQFWNNGHLPAGKNPVSLYATPWTAVADSFLTVWVRVNTKGIADAALNGWTSADQDSVCIMGGGPAGSNLDWGTPFYLTQEAPPTNSASAFQMPANTFYSGALRIPKSQVKEGDDISYKFRLGSQWSIGATQRSEQLTDPPYAGGNRHFKIPVGLKDTTLQWVFFGDVVPTARANPDTVYVTFRADMSNAIAGGGFVNGDSLQVQVGWFGTADSVRTLYLRRQGLSNFYQVTDTTMSKIGGTLDYQYYLVKYGVTSREVYYNFDYTGPTPSEAERRQVVIPQQAFTVYDTAKSNTQTRRQPVFQNQSLLTKNVAVKWVVDLRPAYYQVMSGDSLPAGQGPRSVYYADSITAWGVGMNGPATKVTNQWASWDANLVADTASTKMWDDGTHGDAVAGDSMYTVIFRYTTTDTKGQVYKFGIGGSDNEGGFGNNHIANIDDTDTTFTILTQFGSIDPKRYNMWDFDTHSPKSPTSVRDIGGVPLVYALDQNYPNPFNPTTTIRFEIPKQSNVELKVYNLLGQVVATLVNGEMKAGRHEATFDAARLSSGVYFYKLVAGSFVETRKMLLLK